jgi:hypothetical protein
MYLNRGITHSAKHIRGINVLIWISVVAVHILHEFVFQMMRDETLIGWDMGSKRDSCGSFNGQAAPYVHVRTV